MMPIRLDKVDFSTLHEAPKNYDLKTDSLVLTDDILPPGFSQNYPLDSGGSFAPMSIPYSRGGTKADIYLDGNNVRVLANVGSRAVGDVYQFKSSETFSVLVNYTTTDIELTFTIFNGTGSSVTLKPQTINVEVVLYDMPIMSI